MPDRLSRYVGVIATHWPGSFGRDAVTLHAGDDRDVVLLGTQAAFRFPRTEAARAALAREAAVLTALAYAAPDVRGLLPSVRLDCSGAPVGDAFVAQRYVAGDPLPRASVDALGPLAYRFAAELARVLDAFAAVRPTGGLAAALGETGDALVHGAFTGEHLRWDADETRLTGVLGWSGVSAGDPARDLAGLAATYGWELAATVAAASERDDDETLLSRARTYAG